jgi:hypothetical protein
VGGCRWRQLAEADPSRIDTKSASNNPGLIPCRPRSRMGPPPRYEWRCSMMYMRLCLAQTPDLERTEYQPGLNNR